MRSNPPFFLNSSVVERSAVNRLVVGSNPTWGDLIHSEERLWQGINGVRVRGHSMTIHVIMTAAN